MHEKANIPPATRPQELIDIVRYGCKKIEHMQYSIFQLSMVTFAAIFIAFVAVMKSA